MKKIVLITSVIGLIILLLSKYSVEANICTQVDYTCRKTFDDIENIFYLFPFIFIFSVITYFMSEGVFESWWKFTKYVIPAIFILSAIIITGLHHNPTGQWQDMFDVPIIISLYAIFIIGSIVQITKAYLKK